MITAIHRNIASFSKTAMLAAILTFPMLAVSVPAAHGETPPGRLFVFGVAYDEAPPEHKTLDHYNYAPDNFADLLSAHARPLFSEVRTSALKGKEVTRAGVMKKLRELQATLREEDLLFLYWGTHGGVDPVKGWGAGLAEKGVIYGADIKRALGNMKCPVIAVVSTCGSGGFAQQASAQDAPLPRNVTALCACRPLQSTGNDLDVSLCEALIGFADFDANGEVTLSEAMTYVPRRYRYWRQGETPSEQRPVLAPGKSGGLDGPLVRVDADDSPAFAAVVKDGKWYGAAVLERSEGKAKVRFLGFDRTCADGTYSIPDEILEEEAIDWPAGEPPVDVEWEGGWYPAKILSRGPDGVRIHYVNYPASDDETVRPNRIRYPFPRGEQRR